MWLAAVRLAGALGLAVCGLALSGGTATASPRGYWANWHAYRVVSVRFTASADRFDFDPNTGALAFHDTQTTTMYLRAHGRTSFGYNGDITVPVSGHTTGTQASYYTEGPGAGAQTGACNYHFAFKAADDLQVNFTRRGGNVLTSFIPATNEGGYCTATTEAEAPTWYLPTEVSFPLSRFSRSNLVLGTSGSYDAGKGSPLGHTLYTWSLSVTIARR